MPKNLQINSHIRATILFQQQANHHYVTQLPNSKLVDTLMMKENEASKGDTTDSAGQTVFASFQGEKGKEIVLP